MKIQYQIRDNYIEIVRCFGNDPKVELPAYIDGLPVRSVAAYAFSARKAEEDTDVSEYETEGGFSALDNLRLLAGNEIEEIIFPTTVEEIGRYIFYGCKNLVKLEFSDSLMLIGSGAFTGCGKLGELTVHLHQGEKSCVKEILGELWQRIDVTFYKEGSCAKETSAERAKEMAAGRRDDRSTEKRTAVKLVFPEHYEEAVENTPARILFTQHHGIGNNYRQCFYGKELDYQKYDELFPLAVAQDKVEVLADLAFCRLESGYELTVRNREIYENYVKENLSQITKYLLEQKKLRWLELISERKLWSREMLDGAIEQAVAKGMAEITGYLMNERSEWNTESLQNKKKRFEL